MNPNPLITSVTDRPVKSLVAAIVVGLCSSAASAAPAVQRQTLDNGLEVLVVESHAVPLVTIEIAVKGGAMAEGLPFSGVSHLHEHMFLRVNELLPTPEAFQARWRQLGLEGRGQAGMERVSFYVTTNSQNRAAAMALIRDSLLRPSFDERELATEKAVVIGELELKQSDPSWVLVDRLDEVVWWRYPNRKDPLGTRQSILAATPAKLRAVQRRYYVPNNAVLVVTGDVKANAIFAEADELYRDWKAGPDPFKLHPLVTHPPIRKTEVVIVPQPVEQVRGLLVWHGPSTVGASVDASYAAQLLAVLLQASWSKFKQNVVLAGPCMGIASGYWTQRNTGAITLDFKATTTNASACVKAIVAELPRIQSADYFSDEEMQLAVRQFEMNAALERERPSALAHDLTYWWAAAGLDYYLSRVHNVARVTRSDIARYLDAYVLGKHYGLGVMLSDQAIASGLDKAHFQRAIGIERESR